MTQQAVPTTTMVTFVVRFWRETSAGEVRWRGQIEHVQSGERVAFLELNTMLRFLHRFGVHMEDLRRPAQDVV
jgi:hypothetical protein